MDDDMTTGEAEAWRAGWRAAREAAFRNLKAQQDEYAQDGFRSDVELVRMIRDAIRFMEPPA